MAFDSSKLDKISKKIKVDSVELVYDESIRDLVKILARKAAEEGYAEYLEVLRRQYGETIDQ